MKKKFTFLIAAIVLLTMILPWKAVGQTYVYTMITNISDVTEGVYVIGALRSTTATNNFYFATKTISSGDINTTDGNSGYLTVVANDSGVRSFDASNLPEGAKEFTFTGNNTNGFTIANGSDYLYFTANSGRKLAFGSNGSTYKWKAESENSALITGGVHLSYAGSGSYTISENSTAVGAIRGYANTTSYRAIYLFKKEVAGPTQLATPTNFAATAGNEQASFTWTAVENASSYTIAYTPTGGTEQTVTGITGTSRTITGLTNDVAYTCKIKADGDGTSYSDSDYSSTISVTPIGATFYDVTVTSPITGGSVSANPTSAVAGSTITLTATPTAGYTFINIESNWSVSTAVTITPGENNTATFEMPAGDVTVGATFTAYTVTLDAGNGTIGTSSDHTQSWNVSMNDGDLPVATSPCDETWVFEGWSTSAVSSQTEIRPTTFVDTHYVPTSNITL